MTDSELEVVFIPPLLQLLISSENNQDLRYVIINKLKTLDVKVRFYSASLHKIPECMGIMRNIA